MAAKLHELKKGEGDHPRPGDPLLPWGGRRIPHTPSTRDAASFPKVLMGRPSSRAWAPEMGLRTPVGHIRDGRGPSLPPPQGWRYRHGSKPVTCAHLNERTAGGVAPGAQALFLVQHATTSADRRRQRAMETGQGGPGKQDAPGRRPRDQRIGRTRHQRSAAT